MANWARSLMVSALLLAGFGLKGLLLTPPPAPSPVAAGDFDTNRAVGRLERILGDQRPHPVDSPDDDAVRGRLIAELRAIGLQPEVHEAMDCSAMPKTRFVSCSHVRNVIATIPSSAPGPQLLLNAHYDSTPTGPGAGDDGLGVAVLLEIGSILKQNSPARPVTLLFNEGEEFGLNGAHAFVRDPLARSSQFADQHRQSRRDRPRFDARDQRSQRRRNRSLCERNRSALRQLDQQRLCEAHSKLHRRRRSSSRPGGRCWTTGSSATSPLPFAGRYDSGARSQ